MDKITVKDLITAGLLYPNDEVKFHYKDTPDGMLHSFTAYIGGDGRFETTRGTFDSPSAAALACIRSVVPDYISVSGWETWRLANEYTSSHETLADLRAILDNDTELKQMLQEAV